MTAGRSRLVSMMARTLPVWVALVAAVVQLDEAYGASGPAVIAPTTHESLVTRLGSEYGLSVDEVTRYESLISGPRGHWSVDTHPLMVLGVHARTQAERDRYSELLVEDDRKRTEAILALSRSVQQVWLRKYGSAPLFATTSASHSGESPLLSTDRVVIAFAPGACLPCGPAIAVLQAQISAHGGPGIDLFFLVERDEDIHGFARQQLISPEAVQRKQITLNRADAAWLAHMGVQASALPMAVRKRGDQLTPIDLNQLAQRRAWGGP